jgi:hypothetical protein
MASVKVWPTEIGEVTAIVARAGECLNGYRDEFDGATRNGCFMGTPMLIRFRDEADREISKRCPEDVPRGEQGLPLLQLSPDRRVTGEVVTPF